MSEGSLFCQPRAYLYHAINTATGSAAAERGLLRTEHTRRIFVEPLALACQDLIPTQ